MASSSLPLITRHDVFVSFAGEDIRRTFVSHLYRSLELKGIRTFEDDFELISEPSEIHLAAIRVSKVVIVVVCKNYVSSMGIVRELEEILNCQRNGYLSVFPVYYGIDCCDVKRLADQKQNQAKDALMELACISGEHSSKSEDDVELILKITNGIWDKLNSSRFGGLVGMDLRMRRMYELLSLESTEVREIGIWGRDGLGKRTLAKCVYREISDSFDICVFLEHVNRIHRDHHPFILRQELRSELIQASGGVYTNSGDDTGWLTDHRVLLVVGGVDTAEQLDFLMQDCKMFGPGSRVIVICEDKQLFLACRLTLLYQVEPLEFYEALELLSLRAFNHTDPPIGYEQLLERAIKAGNGYPWLIAAIGSKLFGKPKKEWETILSKYERPSSFDEDTIGSLGTSMSSDDDMRSDDEDKFSVGNTYVGMDCHLQAVCGLMELESGNEIRIVGIWGVGGVGKTTIARCIFDETREYFHTRVFLENVGKTYQDHGTSGLQEDLLWNNIQREALGVRGSRNGFDVTKARLRNRKVLLIVDGVDNSEQIEDVQKVVTWFGAGSRVMVTTRDENLLVANRLKHVYEVKCLRVHEALQFFYNFAFTEQAPSTRFKQLSVRAVQLAGRIPLSLKVLGSCLRQKSGHEWESVLQKLEGLQDKDKAKVAGASSDVGVNSDEEADNYRKVKISADSESSDVTASKVVIKLPEEIHNVARGTRSVYEHDCIPLWGNVSICGLRPEMEDAVTALPHFLEIPIKMLLGDHEGMSPSLTHLTTHFFGVYDGHGGAQVADYCHDRIHFALAEEIERIKEELCERNPGEGREVQWEKVFVNCYLKVNDEVKGKINRPVVGSTDSVRQAVSPETVGSTAVVALICSSHIIVANCGDSRAVLLRGKEAIPLSVDHKANREDEYARIEEAGGKVIQWQGYKIMGVLAVSRSIGDEYLEPYVIPDPEVMFMPRAREDECLILASDGLWDVMSNQEACDFARKRILAWHKKFGALPLAERGVGVDPASQAAAEYLSKLALQKGSQDNISIIVIDLKAQRKLKTRS